MRRRHGGKRRSQLDRVGRVLVVDRVARGAARPSTNCTRPSLRIPNSITSVAVLYSHRSRAALDAGIAPLRPGFAGVPARGSRCSWGSSESSGIGSPSIPPRPCARRPSGAPTQGRAHVGRRGTRRRPGGREARHCCSAGRALAERRSARRPALAACSAGEGGGSATFGARLGGSRPGPGVWGDGSAPARPASEPAVLAPARGAARSRPDARPAGLAARWAAGGVGSRRRGARRWARPGRRRWWGDRRPGSAGAAPARRPWGARRISASPFFTVSREAA